MSDALSCGVLSWAELAGHEVELLPARTVLSCYGGHGHGDGGGGENSNGENSGGGGIDDSNLNVNENDNEATATATASIISLPEGGIVDALIG